MNSSWPQLAPNGEAAAPNREQLAPNGEAAAPNGEQLAPNGEPLALNGEAVAPKVEPAAPNRERLAPKVEPVKARFEPFGPSVRAAGSVCEGGGSVCEVVAAQRVRGAVAVFSVEERPEKPSATGGQVARTRRHTDTEIRGEDTRRQATLAGQIVSPKGETLGRGSNVGGARRRRSG